MLHISERVPGLYGENWPGVYRNLPASPPGIDLGSGGLNLDANLRRESAAMEDILPGHIGGTDNFARDLAVVRRLVFECPLVSHPEQRYASLTCGPGCRL